MAIVPNYKKKKVDVRIKLKNANFTLTLKDKASDDYTRLRNNVENAVSSTT